MTRALQKHVARRQDQTFADWFAELRELARALTDDADQAPTVYAVWGGGATPAQALYMVGVILPPTAVTIRIILNPRLAAGAVSGGGVDQAYDRWRVAVIRSSRLNDASAPKPLHAPGISNYLSARCWRL
jgi:hypothetical protein